MNIIKCSLCQNDSKLIVLSTKLETVIFKLLSIQLQHVEGEPNLICSTCCTTITNFNKFRRKIKKLRKNCPQNQISNIDSTTEDSFVSNNVSNIRSDHDHDEYFDTEEVQIIPTPVLTTISLIDNHVDLDEIEISNDVGPPRNVTPPLIITPQLDVSSQLNVNPQQNVTPSCRKCSYTSKDEQKLARHIRTHFQLTKEQRICSTCFTICDSMKNLLEHRRSAHPDDPTIFQCKLGDCEEQFTDKTDLRMHQLSKHAKQINKFECKFCHHKFNDKLSLRVHKCRLRKFECLKQCGNRFETETELKLHFKRCRPTSCTFKCNNCQKVISSLRTFKGHKERCDKKHLKPSTKSTTSNVIEKSGPDKRTTKKTVISEAQNVGTFNHAKKGQELNSVSISRADHKTHTDNHSKSVKDAEFDRSFISEKPSQIRPRVENHITANASCQISKNTGVVPVKEPDSTVRNQSTNQNLMPRPLIENVKEEPRPLMAEIVNRSSLMDAVERKKNQDVDDRKFTKKPEIDERPFSKFHESYGSNNFNDEKNVLSNQTHHNRNYMREQTSKRNSNYYNRSSSSSSSSMVNRNRGNNQRSTPYKRDWNVVWRGKNGENLNYIRR